MKGREAHMLMVYSDTVQMSEPRAHTTHPIEASRFLFSEDPLGERVGASRDCFHLL